MAEKDVEIHRLLSEARIKSLKFARKQRKLQPAIERAKAWIKYYEKKSEATKAKKDLAMLEYWRNELATRENLRKLQSSTAKYRWTHETTDLTKMRTAQAEYYEAKVKILPPKEAEITKKKLAQLQPLAELEKTIDETMYKAGIQDLMKQIKAYKIEKKVLTEELWKHKRKPSGIIGYILLSFGIISLILSVPYASSILAFIGLGLTFWGALLLFLKPTKLVKADLLNSTIISSLKTINQIISNSNSQGKAIYLPPKYLKNIKGATVFIPAKKETILPSTEEIAEEKIFLENPNGMCITPPGLGLTNLFEKELKTNFLTTDITYLQNNLPKLFIEDLEIAENFEMNTENSIIHVKITETIYKNICKETRKLSNICNSIGCPLCSSIAIALTRATGKPVTIEKTEISGDGKTIEAYYRIIEE